MCKQGWFGTAGNGGHDDDSDDHGNDGDYDVIDGVRRWFWWEHLRRLVDYDNDGVQEDAGENVLEDLLIMMQMMIKSGLTHLSSASSLPAASSPSSLLASFKPSIISYHSDKQSHHHVIDC